MLDRRRLTAVAVGLALAGACGCGAQQPQPPPKSDQDISAALEGIAQACGEAYQSGRPGAQLESEAAANARKLAHAFREGPDRVYQSDTLRQIVALSVSYLRECGLRAAAAELRARA